jgi:hypothetical protein
VIIDTNRRTTPKLPCLRGEGVETIIRYYARTTRQTEKRLTRSEAEAIIAAGISIAIVHQAAGDSASAFSRAIGQQDAGYVLDYASSTIGQPAGSAIYFAIDYDCDADDVANRIVPYFEAVKQTFAAFSGPRYTIGAYGNGAALTRLLSDGLVDFTWLSQSTGFTGSRAFKRSNRWTLFQHLPSTVCGLDVDVDDLNANASSFGAFLTLGTGPGQVVAMPVPAGAVENAFTVRARSGLRLRSGPGLGFEVIRLLPPGTTVFVVSRSGDWAIVDLTGDGLIDGAVHASFLSAQAVA